MHGFRWLTSRDRVEDDAAFSDRPTRGFIYEENRPQGLVRACGLPFPGNAAVRGSQDCADTGTAASQAANCNSRLRVGEPNIGQTGGPDAAEPDVRQVYSAGLWFPGNAAVTSA